MRITLFFLLLAALLGLAWAQTAQVPVIVSYSDDTPQSVIDEAMEAIKKAGGVITHEYSIIKGFAAKASEKILDTVQALGTAHNCKVEADQIVGTQ